MTTEAKPRLKITYATLRNDNEELHAQYEAGLARARTMLGGHYRNFVGGVERDGDGTFEKRTPIDGSVMGTFAKGTRKDVQDAIAAARRRRSRPGVAGRGRSGSRSCAGSPTSSASARWSSARCSRWRSARTASRRSATSRRRPTSSAGRAT